MFYLKETQDSIHHKLGVTRNIIIRRVFEWKMIHISMKLLFLHFHRNINNVVEWKKFSFGLQYGHELFVWRHSIFLQLKHNSLTLDPVGDFLHRILYMKRLQNIIGVLLCIRYINEVIWSRTFNNNTIEKIYLHKKRKFWNCNMDVEQVPYGIDVNYLVINS